MRLTRYVTAVIRPCLLLLVGGLAAQHSTLLLPSDPSRLLLVASLCALALRRGRAIAWFFLGFSLFMLAAGDIIGQRLQVEYQGDSMLTRVRISDFPKVVGDSVVLVVEPIEDHRLPPRSRVTWFEPPHIPAIGEVWELELRLRRPRGNSNPGVFDYESWLFREGLHATGYVVGSKRNRLLWSGTASWTERFRARFATRAQVAAQSAETAAVLAAVGVGLRHEVTREQWDLFAITGTSHLMAISGLHVGLAALAAFLVAHLLLGMLPGIRNGYSVALVTGTLLALAYAVLSGFGVPARRAVVMLAVAALSITRQRMLDPLAAVSLAAGVVFVFDPIATLKPGFHLSFAAVLALLWLARRGSGASRRPRWLDAPRQLIVMQVFLFFGLVPLTALVFQRFTILATPVNLVAVPLFSLVTVPATLAALVASALSEPVSVGLLRFAAQSVDAVTWYMEKMATLPAADTRLAAFGGASLLLLCLPLAWVLLPRGWPGRRLALLGFVAIACWRPPPPPIDCFDAWVLDVGQGLAVAVQTRDEVLLFDTGMAWRGGGSAAGRSIVPFLRSRGIRRVDRLLISHADLDHSGGLEDLRRETTIGVIMTGEDGIAARGRPCRAGQGWDSSGVSFSVLHPDRQATGEGNAASCVVKVAAGAHSLLLTGDIEAASERDLLHSGVTLASDIVVVPHHGSLTSSTVPFVNSAKPIYAVVSAGYANRWGLPKARVVERWEDAGASVLNTATSGAVYFRVCAEGGVVSMTRERERRHRFWHAAT